ncbi:glycosyltransferase family protein [Arthrobacter sp. VKM Ac-2550]|uniref:glycosyltransferase family protein n=1 Tax=Crystallibacter permensis TaxID=1938888 RepID=UPI002226C6B2|nr:glycosyltransferase [Arthrobacter sp. VKM Ac-2550]MCW2132175.1 putative glycosyl transferase [Arthrobacter sp. VKM Ac-2550]
MYTNQQDSGELRIVLYSHDSQGLGHTRRNLAIAHALAARLPSLSGRKVSGLLVTGEGTATSYRRPEGWDWMVIPGISKREGNYAPRHLDVRMSRLISLRSAVIEGALTAFRPHLVIVDRHAFGVDGELVDALAAVREANPGCKVILGLREVLDDPAVAAREWTALGDLCHVRRTFDELWVYGDPAVHNPVASGEVPAALSDKVRFTGYLAAGRPCSSRKPRARKPYLLTMVGGGSDGFDLTMAAARAKVPAGYRHLVITGPQMAADQRRQVERAARKRTDVIASVPDALVEINAAAAIVTMGGYNSVCEILSTETPALVVPRVWPRQEQLIRARSLSNRRLVDVCEPAQLSSKVLGDWFETVAGTAVGRTDIELDGLTSVARLAAVLLGAARAEDTVSPAGQKELNRVGG